MATPPLTFLFRLICCVCLLVFASAITNNITQTEFLKDSEFLVSNDARFKMGFFTPTNSTNRYIGIWHNLNKDSDAIEVILWIANRNNPIQDSSGVLRVSEDGNLQLLDGQNMILWSTNVSVEANTSSVAELQDTGNLVLLSGDSSKTVWQSFNHPTDVLLPQTLILIDNSLMNQALDREEYPILQSWKSGSDPSEGRFKLGMFRFPVAEFVVRKDDTVYWRSGPWNGDRFLGVPYSSDADFHIVYNKQETTLEVSYNVANDSLLQYFVLNRFGYVVQLMWDDGEQKWRPFWTSMESKCDEFGKCGGFGRCNPTGSPICDCLHGFEPNNDEEWKEGNWTNGCVRKTSLSCGLTGPKQDMFLELKHMKVPYGYYWYQDHDQDACRSKCFETCTCVAYAHSIGIGCMIWEDLIDIQAFPTDGVNLFVRLAYSELDQSSNKKVIIAAIAATIAAATFLVFAYCLWSFIYRRHVEKPTKNLSKFGADGVDEAEFKNLTMFTFEELEVATNNFSGSNKLGEGGFGPVYEGKLENGEKIAVKRLSTQHGQGQQQFMAEVRVISQVQHKYLVRLLGCCVERDEKLLVYVFMPNKSLDTLLFDSVRKIQLDWKKRFDIINGICQGLLYLHTFSIVKVIHRDLKASNILLDEELSPKISDFGLARIFATKQHQANTLNVVGTLGYISPEYFAEGLFSDKSDVFSLGVVILEIISGRKSSSFWNHECLNLVTYTWELWKNNDPLKLVDPAITVDPCIRSQILKCIHLGLLCVQHYAEDRPTMTILVSMLDVNNTMELPYPKQPGHLQVRPPSSNNEALRSHQENGSVNQVTITTDFSGR